MNGAAAMSSTADIGVLTTDTDLVVQSWDAGSSG